MYQRLTVKTLDIDARGMTEHHSVYNDGKSLRCRECTHITKCANASYAANWSFDIPIQQHASCNALIRLQNTQSANDNDNSNNIQR